MSSEAPIVQPTSDRLNVRRGRTVEIVFPKGRAAHYENLTPNEAHQLARQLDVYLMGLRRANIERSLP